MNDIMSRQDWWGQVIDFKKQIIACPRDFLSFEEKITIRQPVFGKLSITLQR